MRRTVIGAAVVLGLYFVIRAAVELVTINYGDPASYRLDWGGPSLVGVLAVHCGPGLVALGLFGWAAARRINGRRAGPPRTRGARPV